ncbi:MAG TPA: fibronectin type III domain-containing protein [Methylomirabilota bacterium]|nr:fibronectin type III domain-containing protein [Methylomirabilota bacterium]
MLATAQGTYGPQGSEYRVLGSLPLPGDQVFPDVALNESRGYIVWEDNATDADGLGISAQRIDQTLTGVYSPFKVNQVEDGQQESAKVAILPDGSTVFIWLSKGSNIVGRAINSRGFLGDEFTVSTDTAHTKSTPDIEALNDGTFVVVWSADGQDGSMQGVYSQRIDRNGAKIGSETRVNSVSALNQRTPALLALNDGGYLVTWIHESGSVSAGFNVDVYARVWTAAGAPSGLEFKVSTHAALCANPSISRAADGSFVIAWSQKAKPTKSQTPRNIGGQIAVEVKSEAKRDPNSWDIFARGFTSGAQPKQEAAVCVNSYRLNAQYAPRLATLGDKLIVVWTTVGQDGDLDGVFGRFLNTDLEFSGQDFQVNERFRSRQVHPVVASTSDNRFLVVWSTFMGGTASFELAARRYHPTSLPLAAPSAPFLTALTQTRINVAWPPLSGLNISKYIVQVDNRAPVEVAGTSYLITGLAPASTHTVRLKYMLADGRTSPASAPASATTWDEDLNNDGLPDDWQSRFWPGVPTPPNGMTDSDLDGASNLQELYAGTDPRDPQSVLRVAVSPSAAGVRLSWNTIPGSIYQVQASADLRSWANVGGAHFASAASASTVVGQSSTRHNYYRVILIRQ